METSKLYSSLALFLVSLLLGTVQSVDLIGDREVRYNRVPLNWFTAYEVCRSQGMQLLTINSDEDNDQIYALAEKFQPRPSFWLAGNDLGHEGDFVWATNGLKVTAARWVGNGPDNYNNLEHCIEITYRWNASAPVWNDVPCSTKLPFFCEQLPSYLTSSDPQMFCSPVIRR